MPSKLAAKSASANTKKKKPVTTSSPAVVSSTGITKTSKTTPLLGSVPVRRALRATTIRQSEISASKPPPKIGPGFKGKFAPVVKVPEPALVHASKKAQTAAATYKRKAAVTYNDIVLEDLAKRRKTKERKYVTPKDLEMLADPNQNQQQSGIDLAHKLADSSVKAISHELILGSDTPLTDPEQDKVHEFAQALHGEDATTGDTPMADEFLEHVNTGRDSTLTFTQRRNLAHQATHQAAGGKHNFRFTDADQNRTQSHGFDPNDYGGEPRSPRSERIHATTQELATILPPKLIEAALKQTFFQGKGITSSDPKLKRKLQDALDEHNAQKTTSTKKTKKPKSK